MKASKRIITFFLALAMLFSLFTFASASSSSGILADSASVTAWNSYISSNGLSSSDYWSYANDLMSKSKIGAIESLDQLILIADKYDTFSSGVAGALGQVFIDLFTKSDYIVMFDSSLGVYRPYDNNAHIWFVNSMGHFPYYGEPSDSGDSGSSDSVGNAYSWKLRSEVEGISVQILPQNDLKSISKRYSGYVKQVGEYYMILDVTGSKVLCASGGHRLAAIVDLDQTAVDQTYNYYTQEGDTVYNEYNGGDTIINEGDTITNVVNNNEYINNSTTVYEGDETTYNQFIDITDNSVNFNGNQYVIDNLYYDESTQSYYVDSHDQYVYDFSTDQYVTNNYTFKITYDVHYTSVTYIGQTDEFEADTYVYYYELPDGRSSADLTAEDLEQLSLAFTDVVNYARSADSTDMRCLYHFDGNVEDSSYWSYCTEFDWAAGASLTYLDEGIFNGSLYLDETEHEFSIKLPNASDAAYDFTLQFRYYQSATAAPVKDSYIRFGQYTFFQFDGSQYYTGTNDDLGATSVGTWNEICMMRSAGVVYYYINGVCVSSVDASTVFPAEIIFHFGSSQQTYKKIDELRYTRRAVYSAGSDYIPSSVPFDTNLTLILPDGERPLADEVAVVTSSSVNLLLDNKIFDWSTDKVLNRVPTSMGIKDNYFCDFSDGFTLYRYGGSFNYSGSFVQYAVSGSSGVPENSNSTDYLFAQWLPQNCLFLPLYHAYGSPNSITESLIDRETEYLFTVVYSDGSFDSYLVQIDFLGGLSVSSSGVGRMRGFSSFVKREHVINGNSYYTGGLFLAPVASGDTVEIVYMEFVPGVESEYSIKWESAMYTSGELKNSPVLAVRSNTPIPGYIFGGVRPSYPERGLVWAMIEGQRIVSLQQYTGSAWVEVDGRIWTGSRWIPYSSFDVFTLQDCWDIVSSGEDSDYEYIYTESGFWSWFQRQWIKFIEKIDQIIALLENVGGGHKSDSEKELDDRSDTLVSVFLNVIFNRKDSVTGNDNNRLTEDNLINIGSVLDHSSTLFDSGFKIGQFFDELGNSWFVMWFTPENALQMDSVSGSATVGDDDPYNMHYYYDHVNSVQQSRGGDK